MFVSQMSRTLRKFKSWKKVPIFSSNIVMPGDQRDYRLKAQKRKLFTFVNDITLLDLLCISSSTAISPQHNSNWFLWTWYCEKFCVLSYLIFQTTHRDWCQNYLLHFSSNKTLGQAGSIYPKSYTKSRPQVFFLHNISSHDYVLGGRELTVMVREKKEKHKEEKMWEREKEKHINKSSLEKQI